VKYCDVCINPWYERELGLIDDKGQWAIWDYFFHRMGGNEPKVMFQGTMSQSLSKETCSQWRIIWGKDVRNLIICDRRTVYSIDLRVGTRYSQKLVDCLLLTRLGEE